MGEATSSLQDDQVIAAGEVEFKDLLLEFLDAYAGRVCTRVTSQDRPDLSELGKNEFISVTISDVDDFVFEAADMIEYGLGDNIAAGIRDVWSGIQVQVWCGAGIRTIEIGLGNQCD